MKITEMKRKDFLDIPVREHFDTDIGLFDSLVIIPTGRKHDSGYMCMDFVAVDIDGEPICRLSGCSDVLHVDGIGGYGKKIFDFELESLVQNRPVEGWRIDCLPCGLLRIFCDGKIEAGVAVSDFDIFYHKLNEQ